jgi:hypothetical protein
LRGQVPHSLVPISGSNPRSYQEEHFVKKVKKRLTYANVMSSLAVFLVLGGATAFAATKIGSNEIKANAIITGKIKKEAVTTAKIKNAAVNNLKIGGGAVTTDKLANDAVTTGKLAPEAVTTGKIATDAVTGDKVAESTLAGVVKGVTYEGKASPGNSDPKNLTVDCGPNRRVIGAFYQAFDLGGDVRLTVNIVRTATIAGEEARGLEVFAEEAVDDADIWQLTAGATCATL